VKILCALVLASFVLACGNDKPPMVPDPDPVTSPQTPDAGAATDTK